VLKANPLVRLRHRVEKIGRKIDLLAEARSKKLDGRAINDLYWSWTSSSTSKASDS
jgi:hypothetical protein